MLLRGFVGNALQIAGNVVRELSEEVGVDGELRLASMELLRLLVATQLVGNTMEGLWVQERLA